MSSQAQGTNLYGMMSPKLKQFLAAHPGASCVLSNLLSEAFTNRTVTLYYFYTDDDSIPGGTQYYPGTPSVVIGIRENQRPTDEYICLVFEVINSERETRFNELTDEARAGKISRSEYATEMLRHEFQTAKRIQELLPKLGLTETEIAESGYYKQSIECPKTFEEFLKGAGAARALRTYGFEYDIVHDTQRQPNAALEPMATAPLVSTNK